MRKLILSAAIAALIATPAAARIVTMEFSVEGGEAQVWTFDDAAGKATSPDGKVYEYTYDETARKLCATTSEGPLCATFEKDEGVKVGSSSPYEATNGNKGVATITEVKE